MRLLKTLFCTALLLGMSMAAKAETTLAVHYPMPGFFKDVMDRISTKFMEENPDIRIVFVSPSQTYADGIQLIMRQAGTPDMPDISFVGLNRLRLLAERKVTVDLAPFVKADGPMAEQGFSDRILSLAQAEDQQVGLAFATSNPIMYYNADLLRRVGADPDEPPRTWDEVLAIAAKLGKLGDGVSPIDFRWQEDEWMFSALLFGQGGTMLTPDERKVAFDGPEGAAALKLLERMVKEGGMPVLTKANGEQAFVAGKVGFSFQTTGALRNTITNVGGKFDLRTAPMPQSITGRLPTGGNAAVMLTRDPAKQDAAWRFIKFAAGPYGASVVVPGTGYVPNNELAARSDQYLGRFYDKNPLFKAGLEQMPQMVPWYSFPGPNGVKITQAIVDNLSRLVEGQATPQETVADMAREVQRLLPRERAASANRGK